MGLIRFIAKVALVWAAACALASPNEARAYLAADRWETTASGPAGPRGEPVTLTWSLAPDGTPTAGFGPSNFIASFDAQFGAGGGANLTQRPWFPLINSAFARWSELGGVTFVYEPHDDGAEHRAAAGIWGVRGDVRLAAAPIDGSGGTLAASQYPDTGDILFDSSDVSRLSHPAVNFIRLRNALMHEIGHALGLDHIASSNAAFLMEPALNVSFDGPQIDDVRGLHFLYGDALERIERAAPTHAQALSASLGVLSPGDAAVVGNVGSDTRVAPGDAGYLSISNRGDVDLFSFELAAPGWADIELTPRGGRFRQAQLGGDETWIDAVASNDLTLELLTANNSLLAISNHRGRGDAERLAGVFLPAAEYRLRVSGSREAVQLYSLEVRVHATPSPEPSTAMLAALVLVAAAKFLRSQPLR